MCGSRMTIHGQTVDCHLWSPHESLLYALQERKGCFVFFDQFLNLDGPYLDLLDPLLLSLATAFTPSTRGNPVSTWSTQFFDQKDFREAGKRHLGFSPLKFVSDGIEIIKKDVPRNSA